MILRPGSLRLLSPLPPIPTLSLSLSNGDHFSRFSGLQGRQQRHIVITTHLNGLTISQFSQCYSLTTALPRAFSTWQQNSCPLSHAQEHHLEHIIIFALQWSPCHTTWQLGMTTSSTSCHTCQVQLCRVRNSCVDWIPLEAFDFKNETFRKSFILIFVQSTVSLLRFNEHRIRSSKDNRLWLVSKSLDTDVHCNDHDSDEKMWSPSSLSSFPGSQWVVD